MSLEEKKKCYVSYEYTMKQVPWPEYTQIKYCTKQMDFFTIIG